MPCQVSPKPGAEYFLRISFTLQKDELWAKKGFEIASQQLAIPQNIPIARVTEKAAGSPLKVSDDTSNIFAAGKDFSFIFNKAKGTFSAIRSHNNDILNEGGGPMLHLWRAPHRNDDMWANDSWERYGLKKLIWTATNVSFRTDSAGEVEIHAELEGRGHDGFSVMHTVTYFVNGSGTIHVNNAVSFGGKSIPVARIGVRMFLHKDLSQFKYFGRGPMENYIDRRDGSDIGLYQSPVEEQLTPYEKPMECGNHEDVRWATLGSANGSSLTIKKDTALLQVSALPYSDEEMEHVEYRIDLPVSHATVLCVDARTLGVGSNSCGPRPLPSCTPFTEPQKFDYIMHIQ